MLFQPRWKLLVQSSINVAICSDFMTIVGIFSYLHVFHLSLCHLLDRSYCLGISLYTWFSNLNYAIRYIPPFNVSYNAGCWNVELLFYFVYSLRVLFITYFYCSLFHWCLIFNQVGNNLELAILLSAGVYNLSFSFYMKQPKLTVCLPSFKCIPNFYWFLFNLLYVEANSYFSF